MATKYVLLERLQRPEADDWFQFVDTVEVDHGPEQAVRRYTEDHPVDEGSSTLYLVIPERNWNVVTRRVTIPAPRVEVDMIDWLPESRPEQPETTEETTELAGVTIPDELDFDPEEAA